MPAGMPKTKMAISERADEAEHGGQMGLHLEDADRAEQHDHGQGGEQRRQQQAAERVIDLRPDHQSSLHWWCEFHSVVFGFDLSGH